MRPPPFKVAVDPKALTLLGDRRPYVLVEFTDYQCPVCRVLEKQIPAVLAPFKSRVDVVVRNFPLSYHLNAYPAALAAEAARAQGKFIPVHDALMVTSDLGMNNVRSILVKNKLDLKRFDIDCKGVAASRIARDQAEFEALHLKGTPSFLLCTPQGEVFQLGELSQLKDLVK